MIFKFVNYNEVVFQQYDFSTFAGLIQPLPIEQFKKKLNTLVSAQILFDDFYKNNSPLTHISFCNEAHICAISLS